MEKNENKENTKKNRSRLVYLLTMIVILIVFLVIYLSGCLLKKLIYSNNVVKQPVNNIYSLEKEQGEEDSGKKETTQFTFEWDNDKTNVIRLYNQFPIRDEVGMALAGEYKTHDFKLKFNTKAVGVKYYITAERLVNSDFDENYMKLYLENEGKPIDNCFRESGRIKHFVEYETYQNKSDERILYTGTITAAEAKRGYKEFTFRMWVSEDLVKINEDYLSQTFLARINVHATDKY